MYYNRARYYNPANGTFNRVDPYAGSIQDPQSLHKYAYVHNNPVNAIDPSGMMEFSLAGMLITAMIIGLLSSIIAGEVVRFKGGTEQQIYDAQWKWLIIGFIAAAVIYAAIWSIYAVWMMIATGAQNPEEMQLVIGRSKIIERVGTVGKNEYTLFPQLTVDYGNVAQNWAANERALRIVMKLGQPIRDASVNAAGKLIRYGSDSFLEMERVCLENAGWAYNAVTTSWHPPGQ